MKTFHELKLKRSNYSRFIQYIKAICYISFKKKLFGAYKLFLIIHNIKSNSLVVVNILCGIAEKSYF